MRLAVPAKAVVQSNLIPSDGSLGPQAVIFTVHTVQNAGSMNSNLLTCTRFGSLPGMFGWLSSSVLPTLTAQSPPVLYEMKHISRQLPSAETTVPASVLHCQLD